MTEEDFYVTSMPSSRPADYYLGYSEGAVFLDFNNVQNDSVCLKRISFDGHGCCELSEDAIPLNQEDSRTFKRMIDDNQIDQIVLTTIIRRTIDLNKSLIWRDALEEYLLI